MPILGQGNTHKCYMLCWALGLLCGLWDTPNLLAGLPEPSWVILNSRHTFSSQHARLFSSFNNQVQRKESIILKQYVVIHIQCSFPSSFKI